MNAAIEQFTNAIAAAGLPAPDAINDDGAIHRFSTNGKPRDDSGWYMLHTDGLAAGAFGCWRTGLQSTWCAKSDTAMTEAEREAHRQRIKAMQEQREAELIQRQQSAATDAARRWQGATNCTQHSYTTAKGVQCHGVKVEGDKLLIPMRDTAGKLWNIERINRRTAKTKRGCTAGGELAFIIRLASLTAC